MQIKSSHTEAAREAQIMERKFSPKVRRRKDKAIDDKIEWLVRNADRWIDIDIAKAGALYRLRELYVVMAREGFYCYLGLKHTRPTQIWEVRTGPRLLNAAWKALGSHKRFRGD